ncbi:MAG: DedA family protein [archaeon]
MISLTVISQYLISTIGSLGYLGIFFLMAIESTIFPLPSELVLIPAGFLAFQGQMSIPLIIILSTLGSLFGSLIMYYLSFVLGRKSFIGLTNKYGKFLFLKSSLLIKTENYFKNHGPITIFVSRLLLVIRHLISIPAGFAKMKLSSFILYTALGSLIWSTVLVYFGYYLGSLGIGSDKANVTPIVISLALFCLVLVILYIIAKRLIKKG